MTEVFFVLGLTLLTGFLATIFFERTKVSQVLILMLFGFLVGPMLDLVDASGESIIVSILPFISTLALIVLLFDGGLTLDLSSVASSISRSILYTLSVFLISLILVSSFAYIVLGMELAHGVLLGAILGGTSSAIVIAMVEKSQAQKETRSLLTVESTITDSLCILSAVVVIELLTAGGPLEPGHILNMLLSSFLLAIAVGASAAFAWMGIIRKFTVSRFGYMLTLALVFMVYSVTEAVLGNGGFAVFPFGLVLGNARKISSFLNLPQEAPMSPIIRLFQEEVTFFVRTFFFVYMGLLLSPSYFSGSVVLVSLAISAIFLAARYIAIRYMLPPMPRKDRGLIATMLPRGLAAAVLASYPLANGIAIPDFQQIVFVVILLTNIAATGGLFIYGREDEREEEAEKAEDKGRRGPKPKSEGDPPSKAPAPGKETRPEDDIEEFLERRSG